jgi:hypothetical protein
VVAAVSPSGAGECVSDPSSPRVLILSVDGVGIDEIHAARERGAYAGWPEPQTLVPPFPSMTNVAFTAIFTPFGAEPISGYEMKHYDYERNDVHGGGPIAYSKRAFPWRNQYQVMNHTIMSKSQSIFAPYKASLKTMSKIEREVLTSPRELVMAHIESTDLLAHFKGNDRVADLMVELAPRLEQLEQSHLERFGRPLRIVMLSDHGNSDEKVLFKKGIRRLLRKAGLDPSKNLKDPDDVIAESYGVCNFGVLFLAPERAETAARAVINHEAILLAAWVAGPQELRVVSKEGQARLLWRDGTAGRHFAYRPDGSDPLQLGDVVELLDAHGLLDGEGYASENDWFDLSIGTEYPDAPRRLVDSLTGTYVTNSATVIFTMEVGYAWGAGAARFGAGLRGGKLEGTHGGLDAASSLGFLMTNLPHGTEELPA